ALYAQRPQLAMVNSDKGITNLHVPSDVIIDASMPAMIREGGRMWGADGQLHAAKAVIPDRCYAGVYQTAIDDCKKNGALDPVARQAWTYRIRAQGGARALDEQGDGLLEHTVEEADIWRLCQGKDAPIQDWANLALTRARATGATAVFSLDQNRAHDANLIT